MATMSKPSAMFQGFKGGDTLAVGRTFPAGDAPVVGGYRLVPVGSVGGEVFSGEPTTVFLDEGGHFLGYGPAVEGVATFVGDGPEGEGEGGQLHHVALLRRVSIEQHFLARRVAPQLGQEVLPLPGDNLGHREAFLGIADGRLQEAGKGASFRTQTAGFPSRGRCRGTATE